MCAEYHAIYGTRYGMLPRAYTDASFLSHSNPDYIKYKKSTPPLLFGVPPLYRVTPYILKLIFCCEFPFYFVKPESDVEGKKQTTGAGEERDRLREPDVVEKQPLQN